MIAYYAGKPNDLIFALNVNFWATEIKSDWLFSPVGVFYKKLEHSCWDIIINYTKGVNFYDNPPVIHISSFFNPATPEALILELLKYKGIINNYRTLILINTPDYLESRHLIQNHIALERKRGFIFEYKNQRDVFFTKTKPILDHMKKNKISLEDIDASLLTRKLI